MTEPISTLLIATGAGVLRSVAGWLENAMKDNKIENYEWGQLGATITKTVVLAISVHYALGLDALASTGAALVGDFIIMALKKKY